MKNVDWSGLWRVFSTILAIYIIAKVLFNACFDLYVKVAWRKYRKAGIMLFILTKLVALMLIMGCAKPRYVPVIRVPDYSDAYARTMCDEQGNPVVVMYANLPKTAEYYVIIHEGAHILQVEREGDCVRFMQKYARDPKFRLVTEAEAECAAFDAFYRDGGNPEERTLVSEMHNRFPDFTEADIIEALECVPYSPATLRTTIQLGGRRD